MKNSEKTYLAILRWCVYIILFIPLMVPRWVLYPHGFGKTLVFQSVVEIMAFFYIMLCARHRKYLPKANWMNLSAGMFLILLIITGFFGVDPFRSFWGTQSWNNGLIVLLHCFAFFIMLSGAFKEKEQWIKFFKVSVCVAAVVCLHALGQKAGLDFLLQTGAERLTATTGNPVYFSSYLMFAIFITAFLGLYTYKKDWFWFSLSAGVGSLELLCFYFTQTRGGYLAIGAALGVMAFFYFIWFHKNRSVRRAAAIIFIACALAGSAFSVWMIRSGKLVEMSKRSNTIKTRVVAWNIAWQGFKAKPLAGWGLENFNAPFEKYFDPKFYEQNSDGNGLEYAVEFPHNKILEVMVSNGIFSAIAYLAIFIFAFILISKAATRSRNKKYLPVLGLLAAYFTFNLVVFDSILSFIFFYFFLGYIHFIYSSSLGGEEEKEAKPLHEYARNIIEITTLVALLCSLYFFNIKPAIASNEAQSARRKLLGGDFNSYISEAETFNEANTFINEKINIEMAKILIRQFINEPPKNEEQRKAVDFTIEKMENEIEKHPNRLLTYQLLGRLYNISGSYRNEDLDKSISLMDTALNKGSKRIEVYHILGTAYLKKGENSQAIANFQKAIETNPNFNDPYIVMGKVYMFMKDYTQALQYFEKGMDLGYRKESDLLVFAQIYTDYKMYDKAARVYGLILENNPNSPARANLDALEENGYIST